MQKSNRQNGQEFFWLLIPFAIWCFIFRDFLTGRGFDPGPSADTDSVVDTNPAAAWRAR